MAVPQTEAEYSRAALRGEPSYVWRAGQERRLGMILQAAGACAEGSVLDNGCGIGAYLRRLAEKARRAVGVELEPDRARAAAESGKAVALARGEALPFASNSFDLILSHEVLEHVEDDRRAVAEMARLLRRPDGAAGQTPGRLVLFVPNRWYPFETHGVFLRGRYHFGNIPLVNYLPRSLRNRLAPHVRAYTRRDLERLYAGLPLRVLQRGVIFGAYDNIIARRPRLGRALRAMLQALERSPLRFLGLSHFWVLERT
jgi:SAM-dependent methyltransferase